MHEFQVFSVKPVMIYKNRLLVKFLECIQEEFSLESDMVEKLGSNTLKSLWNKTISGLFSFWARKSSRDRGNRSGIGQDSANELFIYVNWIGYWTYIPWL